jgi:hypothetical protein
MHPDDVATEHERQLISGMVAAARYYRNWSLHDAHEAAAALLRLLEAKRSTGVLPEQDRPIANPD